ncbi:hypothetical protein Angca_001136, partial [Angiostrongylus cantonensis]
FQSSSRDEKIFWIVVILMCCATSVFFVGSIMKEFVGNQFSTRITIVPAKRLKFPSLVFCPKNSDVIHLKPILNDMRSRIGQIESDVAYDVIRFLIAGSGFPNVDVDTWNDDYRQVLELNSLFLQWRGNRTQYEIFDFVFNKNGYTCQEMFIFCRAGPRHFDCCSAFEATFVMLRGRCFRLVKDLYQSDIHGTDNLLLYFNRLQGFLVRNTTRVRMVAHLGDSHVEVGLYPLLYLTVNNWNHLHFVQRKVSMVPEKNLCSTDPLNQGKSTCFVYNWVNRVMVPTLNCTLPFFKTMLPYTANLSVCEPLSVIGNYYHITSKRIRNYGCLPACERVENHWQITSNIDERALAQNGFGFEASFNELEYEHYLETHTTTPARFISELGSQCGLFVGGSLMTLIQLLFTVVIFTFGFIRKAYRTYIAVLLVIRT